MSILSSSDDRTQSKIVPALWVALVFAASLLLGALAYLVYSLPISAQIGQFLTWLLQLDSSKVTWYITRSAGLGAYLLMWLSTITGLAISGKAANKFLAPVFTFDFHQVLSLLALGFIALHMIVLLFDSYLPYNLAQILVPFIGPYRPVWVGLGVIGMYISVLVSVTFYLRKRIGHKTFRSIHYASFLGYTMGTLHGLFSGTDSALLTMKAVYAATVLIVAALTVYRIRTARTKPGPAARAGERKVVGTTAAQRRQVSAASSDGRMING